MEHNPDQNQSTTEAVLAKIRGKRIHMRSKFSFTVETALAGLVAVVILVVSIAIVSFIIFGLRVNGHESLLGFGTRGITAFLLIIPWPLVALDILLILFLETLLRRFKFGYRSPMLYLLLGLLVVAGASGLLLDRSTGVNDDLLRRADHGGLPPPFGEIYEHVRAPAPHDRGIYRGTVISIASSSLLMKHDDLDIDGDEAGYLVILPDGFDASVLMIGERLYVAGDMASGTIRAFGIRTLSQ